MAAAVERGIEVALVTGRRFDFAKPIAAQLGCPLTMIVNNGALVKTADGVTQLRHLLDKEIARFVLKSTPRFRNGTAVVFDRPRDNQVVYEHIDWQDPLRKGYLERNREFLGECEPIEDCLTEDPIVVMYLGSVAQMREAAGRIRPLMAQRRFSLAATEYPSRNFSMLDVANERVSKGATLAEWAARQGYTRDETMAIGDNHNDREMLEFAGTPVVMANCVDDLKNAGWRTTLSNDDGGVAAAIKEYAIGGAA